MLLASISTSFTNQVASHGAYAVFGLMAIDALFPAFSELVMLYAGAVGAGAFTSAHTISLFGAKIHFGALAFVVMALAGTLGYLVGAIVGYAVGRLGGRVLLEEHGRWFHVTPERLERAERWFARWGTWGVLIGRITPVIRSFVSYPAGALEMPLGPYVVLTTIGSAVWAFAIAGIGYALGASYTSFDHGFKYAEYAILAVVVVAVATLVYRWATVSRRRASDTAR
ncbi:MAG: DedA family protein [Acidobacteriota bacterium]|nr:DedA family protein [Acidobacteriota bacterium]